MRVPQNVFFIFRKFLILSINCQRVWASLSNYIIVNIGFEWVVWIHFHKNLRLCTANNSVLFKCQLDLVAVILIHYMRVDIFYCWMNLERRTHPCTMEKYFVNLYFGIYIWPDFSLPNLFFEINDMNHMVFFTPTPSCGNIISWYLWVQNINRKYWQRKKTQCILFVHNEII